MLSLSDNEFAVVNFLVRSFTERLTVRNIAKKLNFSPAGVYNILKKLERQNIAHGERLGTGLFYRINLESKTAKYLALAVLVGFFDYNINLIQYISKAKTALFDKKSVLFIVDNIAIPSDFTVENVNVVVKSEDEFIESIRKRDQLVLGLLKNSTVVFGEEFIVEVIKRFVERF